MGENSRSSPFENPDDIGPATEARDTAPECRVRGVTLYTLPVIKEHRGSLIVAEFGKNLPFHAKRFFSVFEVPSDQARGQHAHKDLHQFLVCLRGECSVMVDDGSVRAEITLNTPTLGVHISPLVWATQHKFSSDALLFVAASEIYDPSSYIRDYDKYLELVRKGKASRIED